MKVCSATVLRNSISPTTHNPHPPTPQPNTTQMHKPMRSEDESKVNKVTPALVDSFITQLQRDASNTRATPGRVGGGASTAWGPRSWDE